ncbi:DNA-binding response regulator [Galbibacter orientalis]|uniref:Response regulator containing a CheY-like receiver domain and an HTH DNA-binding domain n=1 Tax=Galbibacter orientalis DSM 19592 TaxID=926559 RepID=I3C3P8_9FLAO|nr:response regulator transcription factor [Galbibacter orientalis]EIJ38241.1 response regulator containing a CheY-like receiver domain and an HTH DNA-binding domain [Galbibacter orientalis DSM 19592]
MFKKVLIAEDIDSINLGLINTLSKAYDFEIEHAKYCDDAYLKIKKGILKNSPFDLLITDLSFKQDHRQSKIESGDKLVAKIKLEQPDIAVIMYSIEDRPHMIKSFFDTIFINGYVCKGRNSTNEMVTAIETVYNKEQYIPANLKHAIKETKNLEIEDYDILLLDALSQGNSQDEIRKKFKSEGITPCSVSTIEKRISSLRISFKAKNATHLVAIAKDLGLI